MSNKLFELAIEKDIRKQYVDAVKLYENILDKISLPPVDVFVNLGFLYWMFASETTFNKTYGISDELSITGGNRYNIILNKGIEIYPNNVEIKFWGKYFSHILFNSKFTQLDCEEIIQQYGDGTNIVPYFYLYFFNRKLYSKQRDELLKQCVKWPTSKNDYIKSVLTNN